MGTCEDSTDDPSIIPPHLYLCTCVDGYTNTDNNQDCGVDIDECASSPCQNGATCTEAGNTSTFEVDLYSCACPAGFANGMCNYVNIGEYNALCNVATGGNCNIDVDECASSPCQNDAACSDSHDDSSIPYHTYRCTCHEGYTSGDCDYDNIGEYDASCTIMDTGAALALLEDAGNCEVDLDECDSSPCDNLATCTDSTNDPNNIPVDAYSCSCVAGFTNGNCSTYTIIDEFAVQCAVALGGNCDVDVDECLSFPCENGASCTDSTDVDGMAAWHYECACVNGFAGVNCELDINECASGACQNGATCHDSTNETGDVWGSTVDAYAYMCTCVAGFANNGTDQQDCAIDVDECESSPCMNG